MVKAELDNRQHDGEDSAEEDSYDQKTPRESASEDDHMSDAE